MSLDAIREVGVHLGQRGPRVALLENLRFWRGEKDNDDTLASQFGELADLYVNDAFGTCHRRHSSIDLVTKKFEGCAYGGFLLHEELARLEKLRQSKERPNKSAEMYVVVLGGREIDHRCAALLNLKPRPDCFLIGGDCAYTLLDAQGHQVGTSYVDRTAGVASVLSRLEDERMDVVLPVDVLTAMDLDDTSEAEEAPMVDFPRDKAGFDIGKETRKRFRGILAKADRILWVGPMGVFTDWRYNTGTREIVKGIAFSGAYTVAGGADTMWAINHFGLAREFTHISTGGSAMLLYLSGSMLAGIQALKNPGAAGTAGSGSAGVPRDGLWTSRG
jgi:phosphoglycerate kinase